MVRVLPAVSVVHFGMRDTMEQMARGMAGDRSEAQAGMVWLVGAGPGDPELITVKGLRCLRRRMWWSTIGSPTSALLERVPARRRCASSRARARAPRPEPGEINAVLVEHGRAGKRVVRLKAGDPFVFGRGGEEAEALVAAGVRYEVVPGVTSAIAAPAYAGIPVTHRDFTPAFTVVTGHEDPGQGRIDRALGRPGRRCRYAGLPDGRGSAGADRRAADRGRARRRHAGGGGAPRHAGPISRWCTAPWRISRSAWRRSGLPRPRSPWWAGGRPGGARSAGRRGGLAGKTVLVTRAREQASALSALLRSFGAEVVEFPAIRIAPADDYHGP